MSLTVRVKIKAYLELMRFPNTFTAMADVVAGYLIIGASEIHWPEFICLLLSTTGIYAGGCALNDFCDRKVDAKERPSRPIPSGRTSPRETLALACILFGIGLLGASLAGLKSFVVAFIIVLFAFFYDGLTKELQIIGPLNMALCRAFNLLLGMSPALPFINLAMIFPLISLVYVFILTTLSKFEVGGRPARKGWIILGGWVLVLIGISYLKVTRYLMFDGFIFLGVLALFTGPTLFAGLLKPEPHNVGRAVKFLVLGIPFLDAVYVSGMYGWPYGVPVALFAFPSIALSSYFYVT
jgi:4-hydroxybenzoate polyprenyltransferase